MGTIITIIINHSRISNLGEGIEDEEEREEEEREEEEEEEVLLTAYNK